MTGHQRKGFLVTMAAKAKAHAYAFMETEEAEFRISAIRDKLLAIWGSKPLGKDSAHVPWPARLNGPVRMHSDL